MLTHLSIANFAIIDQLELSIKPRLTTITGETGAGKSILLGALRLVLGDRADLQSLKNKEEKCIVEASFDLKGRNLADFFETHDLDYQDQTIIRREILPTAKSRAFINDVPTTLDVLKELTSQLVDIHSQFETRELFKQDFLIDTLDSISGQKKQVEEFQTKLSHFEREKRKFKTAQKESLEFLEKLDYNRFVLNELQEASLVEGELEQMEEELKSLEHADVIQTQISSNLSLYQMEELGLETQLHNFENALSSVSSAHPNLMEFSQRAKSLKIELKDLIQEMTHFLDKLDIDPQKLLQYQTKTGLYYQLLGKYKFSTPKELIAYRDSLQSEISEFDHNSDHLETWKKNLEILREDIHTLAENLTVERKKAALIFEKEVLQTLSFLGMDKSSMQVHFEPLEKIDSLGNSYLTLLFSSNPGVAIKPIEKAASGGELSRVMLALKKITSHYKLLPTLILDEIDTGVSGSVAHKIGEVMKEMSVDLQVLTITHLAQVAAMGNQQNKVFKTVVEGQTRTQIVALSSEERIEEIATLLSGEEVTSFAIAQAKQMLGVE